MAILEREKYIGFLNDLIDNMEELGEIEKSMETEEVHPMNYRKAISIHRGLTKLAGIAGLAVKIREADSENYKGYYYLECFYKGYRFYQLTLPEDWH